MTNDKEKEQLWEKFIERFPNIDFLPVSEGKVFDFFYQEIQARENQLEETRKTLLDWMKGCAEKQAKISHLESIIQAADEVMKSLDIDHRPNWVHNTDETFEAIEKYKHFKSSRSTKIMN